MTLTNNKKLLFTVLLCISTPLILNSQQPVSPLVSSFEQHLKLKNETSFRLEWICLGPTVNSARLESIQLDPVNPGTIYAAFGSGNLWKSVNHGISWKAIFEDRPSLGIGDIALAPSNPNIIYLGTGESLKKARNFTMPGNGIYRSDDAGENWKHIGLNDSWHIGEIAIHPTDPDIAVVAVLGHFWTTNENRGLYLTRDGGITWKHVLYLNEKTGANDVVISPSDPEIVYATMWENNPGISGKNSGVYKSSDGGNTWNRLSGGLPEGPGTGRTSIAVSYSDPDKAYVLIDNLNNEKGISAEVYQTTDGGKTWNRTHKDDLKIFSVIGWYFTDIYVSPEDDQEIFALGVRLAHSADGGKTFSFIGGDVAHVTPSSAQGMHLDHCELWINPDNSQHLALANDGGLYISYDKGQSWMHYNNIPAGEFYNMTLDYRTPYNIYGGTQDDATVYGPAREWNPDFPDPWRYFWIDAWNGGDGCVTQVDPDDSNTVYFSWQHGATRRMDMSQDTSVSVRPKLPKGSKDTLMFNFVTPYFISPHNSKTLYQAGNFVFKTTDRGDHWDLISGDLSKSDIPGKHSLAAGSLAESPLQPGLLYMGTDRGACWLSINDGKSWQEISTGIANGYIRSITPSKFKKERVYLAMTGINYDDLNNYLYVSEDLGQSWKQISSNLPAEPANVIIEDPTNENILYAGLYRGVYISADRGLSWSYLGKTMPATSIADLEIHEPSMDLIAATHGRGFYKINLKPIQALLSPVFNKQTNYLFEIPESRQPWHNDTHGEPNYRTVRKIPVSFWLINNQEVELELFDEENENIWSFKFQGVAGLNQYRWDMVLKREESDNPYFVHYERFISPGTYMMQLMVGNETFSRELVVLKGISPNVK